AEVGFRVVVVDRRPGYLTVERFPTAARLVESDGAELLERLALDAASYAVVMTHNFADDQAYLRALLDTPAAYIGMLGPRQRIAPHGSGALQDVAPARRRVAAAARCPAGGRSRAFPRRRRARPRGRSSQGRAEGAVVRVRCELRLHRAHQRVVAQGPRAARFRRPRRRRDAGGHGAGHRTDAERPGRGGARHGGAARRVAVWRRHGPAAAVPPGLVR